MSSRIGHFAANTELYLCEQDAGINVPKQTYIDIFFFSYEPVCNQQMAIMWKRILHIWPSWLCTPLTRINRLIPGGSAHEIGDNTNGDRDVLGLLNKSQPHLKFTMEEEEKGKAGLSELGIPLGERFVCMIVRDAAYLSEYLSHEDFSYHNYRDCDVKNFLLSAEELANRGYFVIRMGVKVLSPMYSKNPKVIDYATNGLRSDLMDIYLGSRCDFCITVGTGFDAIPLIFHRPIVQVNAVPLGYCHAFDSLRILLFKHHIDSNSGLELCLSEIFSRGIGFCLSALDFESKGVTLIENTPEEIRDVVIEMVERLAGNWHSSPTEEALQQRFWEIFPTKAVDAATRKPLYGEFYSRFGANYLQNNPEWLC